MTMRDRVELRHLISLPRTIFLKLLLFVLWSWHYFISPLFGQRCRFFPSCSCYAMEALQRHGILKGGYLSFLRLLRCHPANSGGDDPVPE